VQGFVQFLDNFRQVPSGSISAAQIFPPMERLVQASIDGSRTVVLCAPYGEQSRMTIRGEASRLDEEAEDKELARDLSSGKPDRLRTR